MESPSESALFSPDNGTLAATVGECLVRPEWRRELARVSQILAGETITAEPDVFLRAIDDFAQALPSPSTRAEAGVVWDSLWLQVMRAGQTHHGFYHRFLGGSPCAFSGVPFSWDGSTPGKAVTAWAVRYAASFEEMHVVPPAIRAARLLRTRYSESWPMERLSAAAGSSRSNLRRRFERVYGVSPHRFQTSLRLRAAAMAIRQRESKIEAVARSVGYASAKDMYAAFREVVGIGPASLRALSAPAFDELLRGPLRVTGAFERRARAGRVRSKARLESRPSLAGTGADLR